MTSMTSLISFVSTENYLFYLICIEFAFLIYAIERPRCLSAIGYLEKKSFAAAAVRMQIQLSNKLKEITFYLWTNRTTIGQEKIKAAATLFRIGEKDIEEIMLYFFGYKR